MEIIMSYSTIIKVWLSMYLYCYYNMTNTRFLLFLKAWVLICSQHTVCTHSLRLKDLSPQHTPHLSLLKSKHHPWSRLSLFPSRPSNERAHSPFPPSLVRAPARSLSSDLSLTHIWTDGCNSFHFLPCEEQAATAQVILFHKTLLIIAFESV